MRLRHMMAGGAGYPADIGTDPCGINNIKVRVGGLWVDRVAAV